MGCPPPNTHHFLFQYSSLPFSYSSHIVLLTHMAYSHLKNFPLAIPLASTSSLKAPSLPAPSPLLRYHSVSEAFFSYYLKISDILSLLPNLHFFSLCLIVLRSTYHNLIYHVFTSLCIYGLSPPKLYDRGTFSCSPPYF